MSDTLAISLVVLESVTVLITGPHDLFCVQIRAYSEDVVRQYRLEPVLNSGSQRGFVNALRVDGCAGVRRPPGRRRCRL